MHLGVLHDAQLRIDTSRCPVFLDFTFQLPPLVIAGLVVRALVSSRRYMVAEGRRAR
jgi:hypothetical protein